MKRYYFETAKALGQIGLAGAIFAENDQDALGVLQEMLDKFSDHSLIDNYDGREPAPRNAVAGISYVALFSNSIEASMEMFQEIEEDN